MGAAAENRVFLRLESLLVILGYALNLAVASSIGSYDTGVFAGLSFPGDVSRDISVDKTVQRVAFVVGLLALVPGAYKGRGSQRFIRYFVAFTTFYLAGFICLPLECVAVSWAPALSAVGGALLGLGNAGFYALWVCVFFRRDRDLAAYEVAVGSLLSGVVFLLESSGAMSVGLPGIGLAICFAAFALFVSWCVATDRVGKGGEGVAASLVAASTGCSHQFSWREFLLLFAAPVVCVASFVFVKNFMRSLVLAGTPFDIFLDAATASGRIGSAFILILVLAMLRRMPDFSSVYRVLGSVISIAFVLTFFFGSDYRYVLAGFTFFASSFVSMMIILTCVKEAQDEGYDPLFLYGLFAGLSYGVGYLGIPLGEALAANADATQACALVIVLVNAVLIGFTVIDLRNVNRLIEPGRSAFAVRDVARPSEAAPSAPETPLPSVVRLDSDEMAVGPSLEGIAQEYGLSEREMDVFVQLSKGRDIYHIADGLFISKNTVRTHTRNVYRKLGVHSKQELIDLIEAFGQQPDATAGDSSGSAS